MVKSEKITIEMGFDSLKIRISGLLHIYIIRSQFLGFQSWKWSDQNKYGIDFELKDGSILCEYDDGDRFATILNLLDKSL